MPSESEIEAHLSATMLEFMESVKDQLDKRRNRTALILLFSAIDIFGALMRPKSQEENHPVDFKNWINRFLLAETSIAATADDLWAARCGLLHMNSPGSRDSKKGKAREIHYLNGNKRLADFMQQEFANSGEEKVIVHIDSLFNAFIDAVTLFGRAIKDDAEVRSTVFHHEKRSFILLGFSSPPKSGI